MVQMIHCYSFSYYLNYQKLQVLLDSTYVYFQENIKDLPKPVTLQCVHTDGRLFHFAILQLNTLDLTNTGMKNIWYQTERLPLFDSCSYIKGKPVLEGYNNQVIKHLLAFYNNI